MAFVSVWFFGVHASVCLQSLPDQPFCIGSGLSVAWVLGGGRLFAMRGRKIPQRQLERVARTEVVCGACVLSVLAWAASATMGRDLPPFSLCPLFCFRSLAL